MIDQPFSAGKQRNHFLRGPTEAGTKLLCQAGNYRMCCQAWRHLSHLICRLFLKCPNSISITDKVLTADKMQGSQFRGKKVETNTVRESTLKNWLWEKNPSLRWGVEPMSAACWTWRLTFWATFLSRTSCFNLTLPWKSSKHGLNRGLVFGERFIYIALQMEKF